MEINESTVLKLLRDKTRRPLKIAELARALDIPENLRREFRDCVKSLVYAGKLVRLRGGRYGLPDEMNLVAGTLHCHPDGYGFLIPDKPGKDVFIGRRCMKDAMHRDRVLARVESRRDSDRLEGRIVRIVERGNPTVVGTFQTHGREGWIVPSEARIFHDILIPLKERNGARDGQVVVAEITAWPTESRMPVGRVAEVLGFNSDPEVEIQSILRKFQIRDSFPEAVLEEARQAPAEIGENERRERLDLTGEMIFTIDGERAKDFDDAVSLEKSGGLWRLGVHIADVSHYVTQDSALDKEAYDRGTSVYYPDGVVPMLPFELSNEICSLKPNVERLTLSVFMDFDEDGEMRGYKIADSIIRSKRRFTYTQVAHLLDKGDARGEFAEFMPTLSRMRDFSQLLRKRRFEAGSVDFNIPEAEVFINDKGGVERIAIAEHNLAHELIEEFMLSANRTVARHLAEKEIPSIHRVHESPDPDKLHAFNEFIKNFGLRLNNVHDPAPKELQNLLKKSKGHAEERVINTLLLRAMKKALYLEQDPGHYCLAFEHYTHFTSPIRRYPDLIVHRLVKSYLRRKCTGKERRRLFPVLADCAEQSSAMERKAMEAEREILDLRRAQYMADKVGSVHDGIITSVTSFGFFVELENMYVEGLVRVSTLGDDYYLYVEESHKLRGQHKRKEYRIGQKVKVRVAEVDLRRRRIDLSLAK